MGGARVNLYVDRDTVLHRLHPLVKLGILVSTFFAAYLVDTVGGVAPVTFAVAVLFALAGAFGNVRRLRVLFLAIPLATFVMWSLFYGRGEPLPLLGTIGVTVEGIRYGAGTALKLVTFLAGSILFLSITRVEEFTAAMRGLGLPHRVSFTIALSFRLVPLFLASALTVVSAQRARGLEFARGGPIERLRRYVPVVVPVFMGALRRADSMAIALESRGFASDRQRTSYARSRFGARDLAVSAALAAIVAAYVWAWLRGYGRIG